MSDDSPRGNSVEHQEEETTGLTEKQKATTSGQSMLLLYSLMQNATPEEKTLLSHAAEAMKIKAILQHPAIWSNVSVNGGALSLALNSLRRAGKNEIADNLEVTAIVHYQ